ncbi:MULTISPECIES: hypothetical protein [Pseudomonas]|uniref:Sialate O-acetylesterase domain-containing protein n=1 Tax=Pseudomonas promysalinigenes TaxID=485898 RepID=A0ABY6AR96_9PSED|nr:MULTISPECIES: hypothetical protein [Pseudomonas]UXH41264.1 hypothetical protein N5C08_06915 [Pseudomonas promysalinigenes]
MAFNTQNPIPSSDPRDLFDNAATIDMIINSGEDRVPARFGQMLYTWGYFHRLVETAVVQIDGVIASATNQVNAARDSAIEDMTATAAALGSDLNNKHYSTYASMVADPQSRDAVVGVVDADPDSNLNGWYSWSTSTNKWVRFVDQPVMDSLFKTVSQLIKPSQSQTVALQVEDELGFSLLKLLSSGNLEMTKVGFRMIDGGLELSDENGFVLSRLGMQGSNINGLHTRFSSSEGIEFLDENRFILGRIDSKKSFLGVGSGAANDAYLTVAVLDQQQRTDIMQLIGYGQSLSRGIMSLPAISLSQPYQNIMLASGVRVRADETGYNPTSFVPLVEKTDTDEGETPMSALCNGMTRRAVSEGESAAKWVFLATAPGRTGRSVEQLSPSPMGTGDFERMVKTISDSKSLADSLGKSYSVWAYTWVQGENNYSDSWTTSPYQYMQYELSLFDTLTEKVLGITRQKFRPYLFSYQVGAHRRSGKDTMQIALSQWRITRQRPDVVLSVPVYICPVASDRLHLTNEGSWLLGEYMSRAMYETMVRRHGKWRPLEPISVDWRESYIDVAFHVPRGELVLDDALAALTTNFGFDIREADIVAEDIISSVEVVTPNQIRITLARAAATDAVLTYARGRPGDSSASGPVAGPRGNLRDTHGLFDVVTSPLGNTFALHNPCVMFQYDRKFGF